jgi:Transposase, Mutator family
VIILLASGLTVREKHGNLHELIGVEVSPVLISRVSGAVLEEVKEWQRRKLNQVIHLSFLMPGESSYAMRGRSKTLITDSIPSSVPSPHDCQ